ncbi:MAG: hypothetical protein M3Y54_16640 [Bacteroidota bacterium]|nr:hypothetical protein [Bacteroidota bacterium]
MAVECDYALTADGIEISIFDAISGTKGYLCKGCHRAVIARKGQVNEPHFAHLASHKANEVECHYSSETYRHEKAKEILLAIKQVQVPNVYAAYPPEYTGRVPLLAKACTVDAVSVLDERNVYINEIGDIKWVKRGREGKFDDKGGKWELLVRPDIIFLDAAAKPILFIEIAATHKTSEKKLTRLHLLKINTIEVFIPKSIAPEDIKPLFYVTSHTTWLYNAQRAAYRFDPATAPTLGRGSAGAVELAGGIYAQGETIGCRRARLANAVRFLRSCLGRPDIRNAHGAFRDEERSVGEDADRFEQELRERDRKADEAAAARVGRVRGGLAERERATQTQGRELENRIQNQEKRLAKVVAYAQGRLERAKEQWRIDHHKTADELREAEYQLGRDRHAREQEQRRLAGIRKDLDRTARELDEEERGLAEKESSIAIAEAAIRRNLDYLTRESSRIEREIQDLENPESPTKRQVMGSDE